MKQDIQDKVIIKLETKLKREPTSYEKLNSIADTNLVLEVLIDEVEEMKSILNKNNIK